MTPAVYLPPSPSRAPTREYVGAALRREQLRRMRKAVLDATSKCGKGQTAVVIMGSPITRADIQAAFDEIDEKRRLTGIELHFDLDKDRVRAIFDPVGRQPQQDLGRLG